MAFTKRGLRLVKSLEKFAIDKPMFFDTKNIFSKIKIIAATNDELKATMTVDSSMCNGFNYLHGGFITSVVDVLGLYAHVAKANGKMAFTTNMSINFISTAAIGENIVAVTKSIKDGGSSILESTLYKENGEIIAKGTACFKDGNEPSQKLSYDKIGFDVLIRDE